MRSFLCCRSALWKTSNRQTCITGPKHVHVSANTQLRHSTQVAFHYFTFTTSLQLYFVAHGHVAFWLPNMEFHEIKVYGFLYPVQHTDVYNYFKTSINEESSSWLFWTRWPSHGHRKVEMLLPAAAPERSPPILTEFPSSLPATASLPPTLLRFLSEPQGFVVYGTEFVFKLNFPEFVC